MNYFLFNVDLPWLPNGKILALCKHISYDFNVAQNDAIVMYIPSYS